MKIKTKLNILFIISVILIFLLFLILIYSLLFLNKVNKNDKIINNLEKKIFELHILTDDYLINHSQRAINQWVSNYENIEEILYSNFFFTYQQGTINKIKTEYLNIKDTFYNLLIANNIQKKELLQGKTIIKLHTIFSLFYNLKLITNEKVSFTIRLIIIVFSLSILALFIIIIINLYIFNLHIKKPLYNLMDEMKIIGSGNLDHQIKIIRNDEIGNLSGSFNIMLQNLKKVTTSINILNKEIKQKENYQKKLEQSNKELDTFASIIAHDLKSPIVAIYSGIKLIKDDINNFLKKDNKNILSMVLDKSKILSDSIEDLLVFSRLVKPEIKPQKINLNELLDEVLINLKFIINESKAKIDIKKLPSINGYKNQLIRLFQNIIANGIKYCDKKQSLIKISYLLEKKYTVILIKDNGIGIEKEYYNKIFNIFERIPNNKKSGSGIGLASVKKIVENHNGKIWLESSIGNGTTFFIGFPR